MKKVKKRWWVGHIRGGIKMQAFRSATTPTEKSHGEQYFACTGPFRTKRGAMFMQDHGALNPHCQHVADAERLGRVLAARNQ